MVTKRCHFTMFYYLALLTVLVFFTGLVAAIFFDPWTTINFYPRVPLNSGFSDEALRLHPEQTVGPVFFTGNIIFTTEGYYDTKGPCDIIIFYYCQPYSVRSLKVENASVRLVSSSQIIFSRQDPWFSTPSRHPAPAVPSGRAAYDSGLITIMEQVPLSMLTGDIEIRFDSTVSLLNGPDVHRSISVILIRTEKSGYFRLPTP